jgi:hypothetical protein
MAITIVVNGESISYPQTGDTGWGGQATEFAEQTASAFGALGLSSGTTVDIPGTLDVTGATTLDSTLTVAGTTTLNGNNNLGNASSDTTAITGILNVDSGVLYVDPATNKVGINDTTPSVELDVNGAVAITGNETVGGTLGVTGDVAVNTNKFNVTASSGNTTIAGTLGVSGNTTIGGVTYLDDDTTANTPVLSFTGDTNTGIGRSAADTLDFITNGNSRFRIEPTGQIKAVYESQLGTDYNTQLDNGYLCRAWVNFDGTGTFSPNPSSTKIRASGNVSSVTDNTTGDYTINFTSAMPDSNYAVLGYNSIPSGTFAFVTGNSTFTTSSIGIIVFTHSGAATDASQICLSIFR